MGRVSPVYLLVKRATDLLVGILGCIVLVPLTLIVKIVYLASGERGPVFYSQQRVGYKGKPFTMHKYRTMVVNADEILEELLKQEEYKKQWETNQKLTDDPRIMPAGKFMRLSKLDEFPQFFNLVKGDMSLVGPRPLVPGELEAHGGDALYNEVKPGITGYWACSGISGGGYQTRLDLEYYYVKNRSLKMDASIVLRTISHIAGLMRK